MSDTIGSPNTFNSVSHFKSSIQSSTVRLPRVADKGNGGTASSTFSYVWLAGKLPSGDADFTSLVQDLINDANGAMYANTQLLVSIAELGSLKRLVPDLLKGFKAFRKHPLSKKSWKDLAGSHLAYSFGLKPLVSDFRALLDIRKRVGKRIRELEHRNWKPVRLTKRSSSAIESTSTHVFFPGHPDHEYTVISEWVGTCSIALSADVESFFVGNNESRAHLYSDALGLSSPLSNVWELIPFSFVIDWFLPIGKAFQRAESALGMHTSVKRVSISNVGYSIKCEGSAKSTGTVKSANYPGWNNLEFTGSTARQSTYVRSRGIPHTNLISAPSGWSVSRTAIAMSLVAQKAL